MVRPLLAPGESEGGEATAEDPVGPSTRPAEESQRGWHTNEGNAYKQFFFHIRVVSLHLYI